MEDIERMISVIVNHSCSIKNSECVYLCVYGEAKEFVDGLINRIKSVGAKTILRTFSKEYMIEMLKDIDEESAMRMAETEVTAIKKCSAFVTIVAEDIVIPVEYNDKLSIYNKYYKMRIRDARMKYCKWLSFRVPNESMAMVTEIDFKEFEKVYYSACVIDYYKMKKKYASLAKLLAKTKSIKIIAPQTHLAFEKEGIDAKILDGKINLPDGEIYTAPLKYTVNGIIVFNSFSTRNGITYRHVKFRFKDGRLVEFLSNHNKELEEILSVDDGAKYVGEFAIGINENINYMIGISLFDEKKLGSIHIALGQCYADADNGNNSALHWDFVLDLDKNKGGGKIYFDNVLVCIDGVWNLDG